MCFETYLTPICPTCRQQDGEPGYESTKCPEARQNSLGVGKCSQNPPIIRNVQQEQYLNAYECLRCLQERWRREETAKAEAERHQEEERQRRALEIQRRALERQHMAREEQRIAQVRRTQRWVHQQMFVREISGAGTSSSSSTGR